MRPEDQYHVGIAVNDFDSTLEWLSKAFGYRWCTEYNVDNLLVTPDGPITVPLRFTYSMDEPHIEVVQCIPGTLFVASGTTPHHLGYWSDDIDADTAALAAAGAEIEGKGYWAEGEAALWAFARPPAGSRIELVSRLVKPSMEQWWATGEIGD